MKSNQLAEGFIQKADELRLAQKYTEALENYNQCLRYATCKSQVLSDAFAGRAKVYYESKQQEKCLDNIQSAINACICDENREVFKTFQSKCRENQKIIASDKSDASPFFKLSLPAHKKIPFIAECLEVRENEIYGRYLMTNKDLVPGDIVVLEEPFYKILDPKERHTRCAVCLQKNQLNLLPCAKCSDALFCSSKCSESVVHRYECTAPKEESFEKLLLQRMFYQAVEIAGSLADLQKLMNHQEANKTIMDFDLSDPTDPMLLKNRILATTSLAEREPWSAEAYAKYESVTEQLQTDSEDERNFLQHYLVRCLKSMTVNFFHFFWSPNQLEGQGFALCSLSAYFAHSCDPNVDKIDVDNKFAFVARKPIKAGEQLFITYDRYSFLTHSLKDRQDYFNKIYTFQCACSACQNDYAQLADLPKFDADFNGKSLGEATKTASIEKYKKNCEYINDNINHYPCQEICTLMIENIDLLHSIGNKLDF